MDDKELAELLQTINEVEYGGLFGMSIYEANELLNLPQDTDEETRRDHFGIMALQAISDLEGALTKVIRQLDTGSLSRELIIKVVGNAAVEVGLIYHKFVHSGRRLLTADYPDDVH